jgi:hypothetical protein
MEQDVGQHEIPLAGWLCWAFCGVLDCFRRMFMILIRDIYDVFQIPM